MRCPMPLLVALSLLACRGEAPTSTGENRLPPPTVSVSASTSVISLPSGDPGLEVIAFLRNGTTSHIRVYHGAQCPLYVSIDWDPTGEPAGSLWWWMACPWSTVPMDLAPGDTASLTRVFGPFTSITPGTYGINVAVTTSTGLIGVWAGAVHLPPDESALIRAR